MTLSDACTLVEISKIYQYKTLGTVARVEMISQSCGAWTGSCVLQAPYWPHSQMWSRLWIHAWRSPLAPLWTADRIQDICPGMAHPFRPRPCLSSWTLLPYHLSNWFSISSFIWTGSSPSPFRPSSEIFSGLKLIVQVHGLVAAVSAEFLSLVLFNKRFWLDLNKKKHGRIHRAIAIAESN